MREHRDPLERLFTGRTPEAAARQLATVLVWQVERELTRLAAMRSAKHPVKRDLEALSNACERLVWNCFDLGIRAGISGLSGTPCPLLGAALIELAQQAAAREAARPA